MNVTISHGWWLLPLAVTVAAFVWDWWMHKDEVPASDYAVIGQSMGHAITFLLALLVSLVSWLIYFVVV